MAFFSKYKFFVLAAVTLFFLSSLFQYTRVGSQALVKINELFSRGGGSASLVSPQPPVTSDDLSSQTPSGQSEFLSNEVLIKVKKSVRDKIKEGNPENTGISSLNIINKEHKVKSFEQLAKKGAKSDTSHDLFSWYKITLDAPQDIIKGKFKHKEGIIELSDSKIEDQILQPNSSSLQQVISKLKNDPNIEDIDLNYIVHITVVPNDPYYSSTGSWGQAYADLWGMKKINAESAWDQTTGSASIVVADIDTGVDRNHEDLAPNMWVNTAEAPGNGIDDDGNGYTDDYYGWNFVNNTGDPMDDHGHGTHTAGTIAAVGNNGIGVVGVNWSSKIMALKFLSSGGSGSLDNGIKALQYAADNGARVSSNSWGCACPSQAMDDAVKYEHARGMVMVAAAGNSNADALAHSPADADYAVTVAASDPNDLKASFSNWGEKIDVSAPGVDILSTRAAVNPMCTAARTVGNNYCRVSGTSMATPHVAGLAALLLAKNPSLTNEEVRQIIRKGATDLGTAGKDRDFGYGRINATGSVSLATTHPLTPIITSPASRTITSLKVLGSVPGLNFASYKVELGFGRAPSTWTLAASSTTQVINGLLASMDISTPNDGLYSIRLTAYDTNNNSYQFQVFDVEVDSFDAVISPIDPVLYGSVVNVEGTALTKNGATFTNYRLEWGVGSSPTSWSATGITLNDDGLKPVSNGNLGTWNTSYLSPNQEQYSLRLTVNSNSAYQTATNVVDVSSCGKSFVLKWGVKGSGDGQFEGPYGVATDSSGNVYVADVFNHRIQKFTSTGAFVTKWGTVGSGDRQFIYPYGIATDSSGDVYVVDYGNNRIQKFTSEGAFVTKWGIRGSGDGQFEAPYGITVDSSNNVYVAERGNYRIQKFTSTGAFVTKWGVKGSGDGQFIDPNGIATDSSNNVYVADRYNQHIQKFTSTGAFITKWGTLGKGDGQFIDPNGIATDSSNNVYVADYSNFRIQKFTSTGAFITKWGTVGSGDGQFYPNDVATDSSNNVYVADGYNQRIQKFSILCVAPPVLDSIGNKTVLEGQPLTAKVKATPSDTSPLTFQSTPLPTGSYFVPLGDVNLDGTVNIVDALFVGQFVEGLITLTPLQQTVGDMNHDGLITNADANLIAELIVGNLPPQNEYWFLWQPTFYQSGSYPITFTVTDGTLSDSESITISVTNVQLPDLILTTLSTSTTAIAPSSSFSVSSSLKNQGTASASSSVTAFHLSKDQTYGGTDDIVLTGIRTIASLAVGATDTGLTTVTVPSTAAAGIYYICATSDSSLTVTEEDETNNSKCTGTTITVALPDTTLPATSITFPLSGSTISGTIIVFASATDNVGVSSVELYADGFLAATDTVSPYEFIWDTVQSSNGVHSLQTKAYDAAENIGSSLLVSVTVNNVVKDITPPSTSIISPLNNTIVARKSFVFITASATDNVGISRVEFYVNAFLQCIDNSSPYVCSWKVPSGSPGKTYKLYTRAFDTSNNVASSPIVNVTAK